MQQVRGVLLALLAGSLLGCDGEVKKPALKSNTQRYPSTGVTKKFTLTISEFDWEVAPGAIYAAIGYNRRVPGPVLEVTAGDRVELTLINETDKPHSAHTHVVEFDEKSDGVGEHDGGFVDGDNNHGVAPAHGRVTVVWNAVFAGTFPYHDHAGGHEGESDSMSAGLVGAVVVHPPDDRPDKFNTVVLMDMDLLRYKSLPGTASGDSSVIADGEFRGGHGFMHTINGRAYEEWVPAFSARVGQKVRWGVVSIGREFHTFHVHGHRWVGPDGVLTDNINLGPGTYATFDWIEDNPGTWLFHCHVPDHMEGGMMGHYIVEGGTAEHH
jgi:manganese oxidase